ncbi:MAG TPA: AbrB/MazE/SpoVT family DNA-binding domain-containing protein, partial [Thermoleophilia bacterium]|nr:AbrB/MazE/SpoVT family DNA-binding domain-containing protein [Thermoleophilia bacterium]
PKSIRDRFGFDPESEVDFVVRDGAVLLVHREAPRKEAVHRLYGRKNLGATTDELMKLLRP